MKQWIKISLNVNIEEYVVLENDCDVVIKLLLEVSFCYVQDQGSISDSRTI